jgi:hypothetical protein
MHGNIAGAPAKALPYPASPSHLTQRQTLHDSTRTLLLVEGVNMTLSALTTPLQCATKSTPDT